MNTTNKKRLFFKGNKELLKFPKVAIVGSRNISVYSSNLIQILAKSLSLNGFVVISGGALGADIIANSNAMPYTIGVFANSLDKIYPKTNESIIKDMYKNALAISEYESDTLPQKWQFLARNKIVVGLCDILVIAQANLKSGSMNSAKCAISLGKEIFVFPHRINESSGTNYLLANQKAKLIDDIPNFIKNLKDRNFINNNFLDDYELIDVGEQNLSKPIIYNNTKQPKNLDDEVLNFIRSNSNYEEVFKKFGSKIFEYELSGLIRIQGVEVFVNE